MRILFFDDDPKQHEQFLAMTEGHQVKAIELAGRIMAFIRSDALPSESNKTTVGPDVDGGVVVSRFVGQRRVDFFCDNEGALTLLFVEPSRFFAREADPLDVQAAVAEAERFLSGYENAD